MQIKHGYVVPNNVVPLTGANARTGIPIFNRALLPNSMTHVPNEFQFLSRDMRHCNPCRAYHRHNVQIAEQHCSYGTASNIEFPFA